MYENDTSSKYGLSNGLGIQVRIAEAAVYHTYIFADEGNISYFTFRLGFVFIR